MLSLFRAYPLLGEKLPYISLGEFPTPAEELHHLGAVSGIGRLYIKRDDLSGNLYGGNKVRKLEFLLGEAVREGAKEVMTFGAAGSNHALAAAVYARQAGLRGILMLRPQPTARYVRKNLLRHRAVRAERHYSRD
ncbi:MAG: pyridoxal-phosphate dependent enzyme, partial [Candidatus Latescibacterota bacterium]